MKRLILRLIGALVVAVLIIILGSAAYLFEFTNQSIQFDSPLQLLRSSTNPIRNMLGLYGFISFLIGLLLALCFVAWLYIKEQRNLRNYEQKKES